VIDRLGKGLPEGQREGVGGQEKEDQCEWV
jgi:hypothetical protein